MSIEKEETQTDMLRSILAQLEFAHIIHEYDNHGVEFRSHLHVSEVHPLTGETFLEREDEGHVLKVYLDHTSTCINTYVYNL